MKEHKPREKKTNNTGKPKLASRWRLKKQSLPEILKDNYWENSSQPHSLKNNRRLYFSWHSRNVSHQLKHEKVQFWGRNILEFFKTKLVSAKNSKHPVFRHCETFFEQNPSKGLFWFHSFINWTSRERPKSALYLRLKILKEGPFGLCETPVDCKTWKKLKGDLWRF